jgi:hypothetical protein
MSQNNNNDKDSKKLLDKKPSEGGEMKKGSDAVPAKGSKDGKKDPKAPKEEELVRIFWYLILLVRRGSLVEGEIGTP